MIFAPGQKVMVKKGLKETDCKFCAVEAMRKMCGNIVTIVKCSHDGSIKIAEDKGRFQWDENCFSPPVSRKVDARL